MSWIIEYPLVIKQMRQQGLKCLYYNSGAFGFTDVASVQHVAWIGPDDPTIRPVARPFLRWVAPPYESNLARLAGKLWQETLPGKVWVMPMSHWAFELGHGSHAWLPGLVEQLGLDPGLLENRNSGAAIEFGSDELEPFECFAAQLLQHLSGSDFMLAFPGRQVLCTLHHHKQLWWQTTDDTIAAAVESLATAGAAKE